MSLTTSILLSILACHNIVEASALGNVHVAEGRRAFRRQDVDGDDIETAAQLDPIRNAVDYASLYTAQPTATYTTLAIGNQPSDASFVSYTTVAPGQNAGGPPTEVAAVQGSTWEIDHIVELQFFVGAFSVENRPATVPSEAWSSVSTAIFTKTAKNVPFPAQQTIASAISNLDNLEGIPKRVNGFKQQVFTGRIKGNTNNPSDRTYPTDFGKALKKLLEDRQQDSFTVIGKIGDSLASVAGSQPVPEVKEYFTSYARSIWTEAASFLDTWTGIPYPNTKSSSVIPSTSTSAPVITSTQTPDPSPTPTEESAQVITSTQTPGPSPAPTEELAPPPAYATGTCSFHLTEREICSDDYNNNLRGHVKMYDNDKKVIGETVEDDEHPDGYRMDDGNPYSFKSKLKDPLVITGEHQSDYVQFTIGSLSWQSKSPNGGASCSVGGWDPRDGPICGALGLDQYAERNMDCSFPC
ncbi:MAG: hypothetical protein Q9163_003716 [Psora crenata]